MGNYFWIDKGRRECPLAQRSQPMEDDKAYSATKEDQQPNAGASSYWQPIRSSAYYFTGALKAAGGFSYHHASRAVGSLSNATRGVYSASHSQVGSWIPDPESRGALGRALAGASLSAASAALDEASNLVPGGRSAYRVAKVGSSEFSRIYRGKGGEKAEKRVERRLGEVERELGELRKRGQVWVEGVELGREEKVGGEVVVEFAKPEDVVEAFVKGGFKGRDFLDMIVVPKVGVCRKEGEKRKVVDG